MKINLFLECELESEYENIVAHIKCFGKTIYSFNCGTKYRDKAEKYVRQVIKNTLSDLLTQGIQEADCNYNENNIDREDEDNE